MMRRMAVLAVRRFADKGPDRKGVAGHRLGKDRMYPGYVEMQACLVCLREAGF